jgi:hypothetical protein
MWLPFDSSLLSQQLNFRKKVSTPNHQSVKLCTNGDNIAMVRIHVGSNDVHPLMCPVSASRESGRTVKNGSHEIK